jgi:copper homeostasis protein
MSMTRDRGYKLEACVVSLAQAIEAQERGADRVELCVRLETEGMTPDVALTSSLCDHLHIPIRVMVRATEQGYEADARTLQQMIAAIHAFKQLPIDGFVLGVLKDNRIDRDAMILLMQHAFPFHITFHKAIDLSADITGDIEWLNQYKQIDTLLTSGGAVSAIDGIPQILERKAVFKGQIMAAGKITPERLPALHSALRLQWYHGKAIV